MLLLAAALMCSIAVYGCSSNGDSGGLIQIEDLPPVVFLADKDTDGTVELYISIDGGAEIKKLSGPMAMNGDVVDFAISPDGLQVAYVADQINDAVFELFVSPVDGSAPPAAPVSGAMAGTGIETDIADPNRYSFAWSSDSAQIAYRATQTRDDAVELYSVRPDGTDNLKLHPDFATGQNVDEFAWAADASRVAYTANQFPPPPPLVAPVELYTSVPSTIDIDNTRVSGDLVAGGNVQQFAWAPDSGRIAYRADQTIDGQFELFVTQPDQQADVRASLALVDPAVEPGAVDSDFAWAPDSSRLAYRAVFVQDPLYRTDKWGLFTTLPDGSSNFRVSGGVLNGGAFGVTALQWAPDSTRLTYVSDQIVKDRFDIFVTTADSQFPLFLILSNFAVLAEVTTSDWSPDSSRIAYIADQSFIGFSISELFSARRDASGLPRTVSNLVDQQSEVESYAWSPDSALIAYRADQDVVGEFELYTAPPSGAVNNNISDITATGGEVRQYLWEPGGEGIGYIADQDAAGRFELYLSLPDGSDNVVVSGALAPGGSVQRFAWVP